MTEIEEIFEEMKTQFYIQNYNRAIKYADQLLEIESFENLSEVVFLKSVALSNLRREEEALSLLDQYIPQVGQGMELLQARYEIKCKIGRFQEAKSDAIEIIKLDPKNHDHFFKLIQIHEYLKEYDEILKIYEELSTEIADDFTLEECKISALMGLNKYQEAISELKKINTLAKEDIDFAWINNNMGFCLIETKQYELAEEYLEKAVENAPNFAFALNNLGYVKFMLGNANNGLDIINRSLKIDPSNSYAFKNRAKIYLSLGKRRKAKRDLMTALDLGYSIDYDNEVEELLEGI